jgi:hypothetical protein
MTIYRTYYLGLGLSVTLLGLITFLILQFLQVPSGNLIDWLIGVGIFWWLLTIVVIPWNVYFEAKEVINEAQSSEEKNIQFDPSYLNYVKTVCFWSLMIAIGLHLISAIALYGLALFQVTPLGYSSAIATLLLTFLRPSVRFYQYLATRLAMIRQEIKYPRHDVLILQNQVETLITQVKVLESQLDLNDGQSWVSQQQKKWQEIQREVKILRNLLEQFDNQNQREHQQISQEAKNAIAQLTEDSQFLTHVREIIRFIKTA